MDGKKSIEWSQVLMDTEAISLSWTRKKDTYRYFWERPKQPPINILANFLSEHGHPTAKNRSILSDKEGGELWGSTEVHKSDWRSWCHLRRTQCSGWRVPKWQSRTPKSHSRRSNPSYTLRVLAQNTGPLRYCMPCMLRTGYCTGLLTKCLLQWALGNGLLLSDWEFSDVRSLFAT